MKTCPACQQNVDLNKRLCPYCGHKFIAATPWVLPIVIVFVILAGVLLFVTSSK
jgi:RNA polymerase subunit RPABC4/transcription elongation factor Spt4